MIFQFASFYVRKIKNYKLNFIKNIYIERREREIEGESREGKRREREREREIIIQTERERIKWVGITPFLEHNTH